ncbi:MAG: peptidoglycan DD-metalloendopeptidase family protein [Eubacterium sp.]
MDKKFIAAVIVCFVALTAVATGTYFLGQKSDENIVNLKEANNAVTTAEDKNVEAAQNVIAETETTTAADREDFNLAGYTDSENQETKAEEANNVVEANTESNATGDDYMYGLSSEAAAQIKALKFNKDSELLWPVQGSILLPYDMENTVYYSTLDQYRCNPGLVIQSSRGTAIKAAADGVITKIDEDDELGVYISQAIGNDYIATYGQIVNPEVAAGDFVEAGQTIAYVNEPTRYYTKEGDNVYFALTKDGESVDPLDFINYED